MLTTLRPSFHLNFVQTVIIRGNICLGQVQQNILYQHMEEKKNALQMLVCVSATEESLCSYYV